MAAKNRYVQTWTYTVTELFVHLVCVMNSSGVRIESERLNTDSQISGDVV